MSFQVIQGDATSPRPAPDNSVVIAHLCNNCGGWGAGFVLAVSKLSKVPEQAYRALASHYHASRTNSSIPLGTTQIVNCNNVNCSGEYWVANMVAQDGLDQKSKIDGCLVDYEALDKCLSSVFSFASRIGADVHIPAGMGSGLAGGDKEKILAMIAKHSDAISNCSTKVFLWEFVDTTATSYVPPKTQNSGEMSSPEPAELAERSTAALKSFLADEI